MPRTPEPPYKRVQFGARLQLCMRHQGITLTQMAERTGLSYRQIAHYRCGRDYPSLPRLVDLVENMPDVNLHFLLTGRGSPAK